MCIIYIYIYVQSICKYNLILRRVLNSQLTLLSSASCIAATAFCHLGSLAQENWGSTERLYAPVMAECRIVRFPPPPQNVESSGSEAKTHQITRPQARASNASQLTGRQVIKHPIAKKTMMAPSPAKFAAQSRATKLDSNKGTS